MEILHVYKTYLGNNFGGIKQAITHMVKTNPLKFNHTVLSLSKHTQKTETVQAGIKNLCYKENINIASSGFSLSLMNDFRKIVKGFDLIHYHFPWPFADLLHMFWRVKKPSILTYHSDVVRQKKLQLIYSPLMNGFLSSVNTIIATSPNYLATSRVLQKYRHKVEVIPIGISKDSYPAPNESEYIYWENKFGNRFFLFVGVLRYYKGLHILLDAMNNTEFTVVIAGSGPLENVLKEKARKLRLKHVHFLGAVSDRDKMVLLNLCLALLFPSHLRSEAFGISLLEGAMAGKPMISCEIGTGTSYINIDGETGIVIPPDDANALQNAMRFLWDNPVEQALMGVKAGKRFEELFTADRMIAKYEQIYSRYNPT